MQPVGKSIVETIPVDLTVHQYFCSFAKIMTIHNNKYILHKTGIKKDAKEPKVTVGAFVKYMTKRAMSFHVQSRPFSTVSLTK